MEMFQILSFLTDNAIDLMNNTFAMCGKLYGYMLNISTSTSSRNLNEYIGGITQSFYVIAGLFMLFRLTVSVFGYILEPDKMTDSKAGGSKLLTNLVVTVILLIAFFPNGFIFSFLADVEDVFLYKSDETSAVTDNGGGFFSNIFKDIRDPRKESNSAASSNSIDVMYNDILMVEDVNAADSLTCYYNRSTDGENAIDTSVVTHYIKFKLKNGKIDKIAGDSGSSTGVLPELDKSVKGKKLSCSDIGIKPTTRTGQGASITTYTVIARSKVEGFYHKLYKTEDDATDASEHGDNNGTENYKHGLGFNDGIFANSVAGSFYSCNMDDDDVRDKVYNKYQKDIDEGSMSEYGTSNNDTQLCYEFEVAPLYIKDAGDTGKKLVKNEQLDAYFFTGILFGIIVMIYLVVLCVEVIIRNLKLILFQVIAPIPLINGIDPNDKMRSKWLKSYFGAYLDLFMKIFAIQLLARLVVAIPKMTADNANLSGIMWKLFFLVALLTFVKMVPNLISKILGIEGLTGSTKEVGGMLKKGLGIGAGMALGSTLGAAVGGFTGEGKGGTVSGALKGALHGAGAGSKGNWGKVAGNVASSTAKENRQRAEGMNWWQRKKSNLMESTGYDPQTKFDNMIQQAVDEKAMLDKFRKNKDNIESKAESSNYLSDLNTRMVTGQVSKEDFKKQRKSMIKAAEESQEIGKNQDGGSYGKWWRQVKDGNGGYKIQIADKNGNYYDYKNAKDNIISSMSEYDGSFMQRTSDGKGWEQMKKHDSLVSYEEKLDLTTGEMKKVPVDQYVKYDAGAVGKILQAEKEMNAEIVDNTDLRTMLGLTESGAREIDTYEEFTDFESKAKDLSNEKATEIIRMQNSDEYRRASGMGSSSGKK